MKTRHRARQLAPAPARVRKTVPAGISRLRLLTFRTESTCVRSIPKSCCDPCGECFPPRPLYRNRSPGAGGTCFGRVPSPDESRKRRKHRSLGAKIFRDDPFVGRSNITELSFVLQDICHFRLRFSDVAPLFFARRAFGRFRGPAFCPGFAAEIPLPAISRYPSSSRRRRFRLRRRRMPSLRQSFEPLPRRYLVGLSAPGVCDAGSDGVPCRKSVVFVLPLRRCFSSRMTADRAPAGRVWRTVRSLSPVAVAETAEPEHAPVFASASTGSRSRGNACRRRADVGRPERKTSLRIFAEARFERFGRPVFRVTTTE